MWKTNLLIPFLIINFSLLFTELGDFEIQLLKGNKNFNFTGTSPLALDIFRNLLDNNIWVSPDMEIMLSLNQINSSLYLSDNDFVLKALYRYTSKKKKKKNLSWQYQAGSTKKPPAGKQDDQLIKEDQSVKKQLVVLFCEL